MLIVKGKHLKTDTQYSFYTQRGLLPAPINMPGYAAIKAALHPDKTEAYLFCC